MHSKMEEEEQQHTEITLDELKALRTRKTEEINSLNDRLEQTNAQLDGDEFQRYQLLLNFLNRNNWKDGEEKNIGDIRVKLTNVTNGDLDKMGALTERGYTVPEPIQPRGNSRMDAHIRRNKVIKLVNEFNPLHQRFNPLIEQCNEITQQINELREEIQSINERIEALGGESEELPPPPPEPPQILQPQPQPTNQTPHQQELKLVGLYSGYSVIKLIEQLIQESQNIVGSLAWHDIISKLPICGKQFNDLITWLRRYRSSYAFNELSKLNEEYKDEDLLGTTTYLNYADLSTETQRWIDWLSKRIDEKYADLPFLGDDSMKLLSSQHKQYEGTTMYDINSLKTELSSRLKMIYTTMLDSGIWVQVETQRLFNKIFNTFGIIVESSTMIKTPEVSTQSQPQTTNQTPAEAVRQKIIRDTQIKNEDYQDPRTIRHERPLSEIDYTDEATPAIETIDIIPIVEPEIKPQNPTEIINKITTKLLPPNTDYISKILNKFFTKVHSALGSHPFVSRSYYLATQSKLTEVMNSFIPYLHNIHNNFDVGTPIHLMDKTLESSKFIPFTPIREAYVMSVCAPIIRTISQVFLLCEGVTRDTNITKNKLDYTQFITQYNESKRLFAKYSVCLDGIDLYSCLNSYVNI